MLSELTQLLFGSDDTVVVVSTCDDLDRFLTFRKTPLNSLNVRNAITMNMMQMAMLT